MSDQEVIYSTVSFLQSPSESQSRLRHAGTQKPGKTDHKEFSVPWHLIAVTLGTLCLLLLITVTVLGTKIFQYIQEKHQQEEILRNLSQNYHIMQNDSYLKEQLLANKTSECDILKNEFLQHKKELDSVSEKKKRLRKKKIFLRSLQNAGVLCEHKWFCWDLKCYSFITGYKQWNECKQICKKYGSSLLKIDDKDELDIIQPQICGNNYWIGLSYNEKERKWKWEDNSASEVNFAMSFSSGRGQCAFLTSTRVTDIDCSNTYNCICEKRID
ncbi:killer cell lectin-like receptor 2 [Choloepus didactylus]|uniref:killer cell lectin-like receptor 2 n=1 Tax=Choloepus didactylus TaxID=27675 RepID=UPI00189C86F4|nr:killer cell lectin-like receptor 2 [Choloepus didactylus]